MSKKMIVSAVALALLATNAFADGHCASGKTLEKGKFTIATGNPAYFPWVLDDAPESGQGFEAAVAYAVAEEMGFSKQDVVWVRSSFDEAIQPGVKNFDVNMQDKQAHVGEVINIIMEGQITPRTGLNRFLSVFLWFVEETGRSPCLLGAPDCLLGVLFWAMDWAFPIAIGRSRLWIGRSPAT